MGIVRLLFAAFVCCGSVCAWANSEVNVEKAGTLSTLLPTSDSKLKVTGFINGTDVKYLRQLVTEGGVTSLDLSDVRIVSGGTAYYESFKTEDDVIGQCMFKDCAKLRTIVLPTTVNAILANAFTSSGLCSVDIPNSVSRLGGDAFAYCNSLATVVIGSRVSRLDQGVFYSSPVTMAYVKPLVPPSTPSYLFSSSPTIRVYTKVLTDYKQSGWKDYGSIVGGLEKKYPMEEDSVAVVNDLCETFFEDAACTTLKAEYQAMSDDDLTAAMKDAGMPGFMTEIAVKLKNEAWNAYEKDFRIHSYNAYSDAAYWNKLMMSTGGSYMGNPTGIYSSGYDPLYVFVDADVAEDATLYIAGCADNDLVTSAKQGAKLTKGLNIIDGQKNALYYIIYTADTKSKTKTLDQWPDIKIHIEGGVVNGYYDLARHSDKDYKAILNAATHKLFTVKGGQSLFNFQTASYKTVWPSTIDKSIAWFDSVAVWQKELMGMCESVATGKRAGAPFYLTGGDAIFPLYYNNPNFAIQGDEEDAGYANSAWYRTSYNGLDCIRNCMDANKTDMDDNCAGHECGHNNQGAINLEGGTEVSNSLFAFYIIFHDGLNTPTGSSFAATMEDFARREAYYFREGGNQFRMYWKLYLYYHMAQKDTSFYPRLFKALREDPLSLWQANNNNSGLKFVRKVCEVAQEDLTDFFRVWGFFEPVKNRAIDDYGAHTLTVRQTDIDKTLAEIAQYPKKNREILFIEDRADYLLTTDFLAKKAGQKRRGSEQVGQCGELGQFTDYLSVLAEPSEYTYLQADSIYAITGSGGLGFLMLDQDDKLVYASNSLNFSIPSSITEPFTIYSLDADGTMHEVEKAGEGAEVVWLNKVGELSDSLSANAIKATIGGLINGTDFRYMRKLINEHNLQSIDLTQATVKSGGLAYYETYRSTANAMGSHVFHGLKKLISIRLPEKLTKIEENAFSNSGLKEIEIPNSVTTIGGDAFAYCDALNRVIVGEKVRTMGQGVFYNSKVKDAYVKPMTPPTISSYLFSSKPIIHVHAQALDDYKASPWAEFGTLVGDLDEWEILTDIQAPREEQQFKDGQWTETPCYDLFGRKVTRLQCGTIYIRNGKKFILK